MSSGKPLLGIKRERKGGGDVPCVQKVRAEDAGDAAVVVGSGSWSCAGCSWVPRLSAGLGA